jgi:indole-3-glycerol phosphate synthase
VSFLSDILDRKRQEVAERRRRLSDAQLEQKCSARSAVSLFAALSPAQGPVRVIAEVKRASPSAGSIDAALDAGAQAASYARGGAAAVSVLTDGPGFGGSLDDLRVARQAIAVPILRKDFIVDRYQLLEAHEAGADAVLLIVAALARGQLETLHTAALELGLEALVEVHDSTELGVAIAIGARLVGVNSRDLKTFKTDLSTAETLLPCIPANARAIAESGIRSPNDVRRLRAVGAANFLVGEALVRAGDPSALLATMMAVP